MGFEDQEPGAAAQREGMSGNELDKLERDAKVRAAKEERVPPETDVDAIKHAEFAAHPHTRLTALAADLGTKRVDLHDRIGAIHRVLAGLIGMALQNTPAPQRGDYHDEERIERHDAVGPEGQGSTGG